eukprot:TRINITY_DN3132_c0_g1_i1.p1 TRINITY_DN3132_c0_g1~~TRINITY_DN3132_c0_g1_i1.p1  ORF type:complete len:265 (+),score=42.34 TRINITY_DN3132_c0_g1_i1:114-908(+)
MAYIDLLTSYVVLATGFVSIVAILGTWTSFRNKTLQTRQREIVQTRSQVSQCEADSSFQHVPPVRETKHNTSNIIEAKKYSELRQQIASYEKRFLKMSTKAARRHTLLQELKSNMALEHGKLTAEVEQLKCKLADKQAAASHSQQVDKEVENALNAQVLASQTIAKMRDIDHEQAILKLQAQLEYANSENKKLEQEQAKSHAYVNELVQLSAQLRGKLDAVNVQPARARVDAETVKKPQTPSTRKTVLENMENLIPRAVRSVRV